MKLLPGSTPYSNWLSSHSTSKKGSLKPLSETFYISRKLASAAEVPLEPLALARYLGGLESPPWLVHKQFGASIPPRRHGRHVATGSQIGSIHILRMLQLIGAASLTIGVFMVSPKTSLHFQFELSHVVSSVFSQWHGHRFLHTDEFAKIFPEQLRWHASVFCLHEILPSRASNIFFSCNFYGP